MHQIKDFYENQAIPKLYCEKNRIPLEPCSKEA